MIIDQRLEPVKMDFSLWSRSAVGQLIEQEFGIKLQVCSIGKYLARCGFTPQKPIKRAYEQNSAALHCRKANSLLGTGQVACAPQQASQSMGERAQRSDRAVLPTQPHSYSPQINPEERLSADLKQAMAKRVPVRNKAKLREAANQHMAMLAQNPQRLMPYLQHPRVRYAD